jgi:hypothetical protein
MKYLMALMIALFVPTAAMAKSECTADREKFCKDVIGKSGALGPCMKQHEAELSEACKAERAAKFKEKQAINPGQQKPD